MHPDDQGIPLLTEVIPPTTSKATPPASRTSGLQPDYGAAATPGAFWQAPATASYQAPMAPTIPAVAESPVPPLPAGEQYRQWEQEIRENVLQSLLAHAETVLGEQLRAQLHQQVLTAVDATCEALVQRLQDSLRQSLAETVTRAVAEEMARFASSKIQTR